MVTGGQLDQSMSKGFGLTEWLTYTLGFRNSPKMESNLVTYQTEGLKVRQCLYKKTQQKYSDLVLLPYCMSTYNKEIADRNNWRETLSTFGMKWITDERKRSWGTKDLLIDKAILKNCWRRLTNLFMVSIEYSKAGSMNSCILKCRWSRKHHSID